MRTLVLTLLLALAAAPAVSAPPATRAAKVRAGVDAQKRFKALLNEGRAAVKADQPELGVHKLMAALKIFDADPSALGELGWACFRAGPTYRARAYEATRRAIALSRKDSQRGALWYNLGRIAEDDGKLDVALDAYRRSLAYRKNSTVQAQLTALVRKGAVTDPGDEAIEGVCGELREREGCESVVDAAGTLAHSCACAVALIGPEPGFGRAALLTITGTNRDVGGSIDSVYLAVEVQKKWSLVDQVGNGWEGGLGYVHNHYTKGSVGFEDWRGTQVLMVTFTNTTEDLDPGIYTESTTVDETVTVCRAAPTLDCYSIVTGYWYDSGPAALDGEAIPDDVKPEVAHVARRVDLEAQAQRSWSELERVDGARHLTE